MSRKSLILCLSALAVLLALIALGLVGLYGGKRPSGKSTPDRKTSQDYTLMEAVPSDAAMVLACGSARDAFALLTDTTQVFSALLTGEEKRGFPRFIAGAQGMLKNAPCALSLHYSGELMPLMIIRVQADTTYDMSVVMSAADSAGLKTRIVDGSTVAASSSRLRKETLLEVSYSETLIAASVRHLENGLSILDKGSFPQAAAAAGGDDALFISHEYAAKIFGALLHRPYYNTWSFFQKSADWSAWTLKGDLLFQGSAHPQGDPKYFANMLAAQTPEDCLAAEVLPATTLFAVSLPIADFQNFISAQNRFKDADGSLSKWQAQVRDTRDSTGTTPLRWAEKLDIREICKAVIRTGNGLRSILLVRPGKKDPEILLRGTGLTRMQDCKPAVLPYAWSGYADVTFGRLFQIPNDSFFTWTGTWMVVGDEPTVNAFVSGDMLKYTLKAYCADNGISLPKQTTALAWYSPSEDRDGLAGIFEKPLKKAFRKSLEGISAAPMLLSVKGNTASLSVSRVRVPQVKSALSASADTTVEIPAGPFKVTNAATGKANSFGQADNGTLTLRDENGKALWGIPFKERLCGRVSDIDYYANGKIQFLFAAGSKLYLIDRLGRFVKPFPVELGKPIRLGPDVYDFTGAKGYSAMVLHNDNTLGLYDLHGRVREGWTPIRGEDTIKNLPELLTIKGKKYWAVRTASRTDIYAFGGGQPLTKAAGDKAFRHDTALEVNGGSVSGTCYDGKVRSVKIAK